MTVDDGDEGILEGLGRGVDVSVVLKFSCETTIEISYRGIHHEQSISIEGVRASEVVHQIFVWVGSIQSCGHLLWLTL